MVNAAEFKGVTIGLNNLENNDVSIFTDSASFFMRSGFPVVQEGMMTRERIEFGPDALVEVKAMQIYRVKGIMIVPQELETEGMLKTVTIDPDKQNTGLNSFIFNVFSGNEQVATINILDNASEYRSSASAQFDGKTLEISYGSEEISLPFSLRLNDFVLERYPGSNSPSGYKSNIVLIDKAESIEKPFTIFMNNILKHKGYRFYQSSYDKDEMGTILSVNHDRTGMLVTYAGYGLLFLFIILSLLNRKSVFYTVNTGFWYSALRKKAPAALILFLLSGLIDADAQRLIPPKDAADSFGNILVQDQKGRTKPLFTLSNDILRKVTRENKFDGLTSMQVYLGVYLDFENWKDVPLIRVSSRELQKTFGISGNYGAFTDFVDLDGGAYKLSEEVGKAYSKSPGARTKADKEIMKIDERVNIIYMIYTEAFLKIFPNHKDPHTWSSPQEALKMAMNREDSLYLANVIHSFADALRGKNSVAF